MFTLYLLYIFILLLYLNVQTDSQEIEVVNSGMSKLQKNDMLVVFFVTIKNFGKKPRRVMTTGVECCERVTQADIDCNLIDLFGGDFGAVEPGCVRNLTFLYPNLYGYNRRGHCTVKVLHRDMSSSLVEDVQHRIDFDTTLSPESVPHNLRGLYDPEAFIPCESPDLDPLDHCNPVDCRLKYSGRRNFYNQRTKRCQKVPKCIMDPKKDLPDVVYVPWSNTCLNLEKSPSKEELKKLASMEYKDKEEPKVNVRCHHGEVDPKTGICICDYGWKSEPFNPDVVNSQNSYYSMCTIQCHPEDPYKHLAFWAGCILGMWMLMFVSLCERNSLFDVRKKRKKAGRERYLYCTTDILPSSGSIVGSECSSQ